MRTVDDKVIEESSTKRMKDTLTALTWIRDDLATLNKRADEIGITAGYASLLAIEDEIRTMTREVNYQVDKTKRRDQKAGF